MRYFFALSLVLVLTGCDSFSKREIPKSEIITTFDPNTRSTNGAVNELANSLTSAGLRLEGSRIQLKVTEGSKLKRYAEKILFAAQRTVNFEIVSSKPHYIMTARFVEITPDVYNWEVSVASAGAPQAVLWRQSVKVDTYKMD